MQSKKNRPRRFIAAAVCPQCDTQDTLYFLSSIGGDFACAECGYSSKDMNNKLNSPNKTRRLDNREEIQPIKIMEQKN